MNTNDSEPKLEKCDGCNDWFPLRQLSLEYNCFLCSKCLAIAKESENV